MRVKQSFMSLVGGDAFRRILPFYVDPHEIAAVLHLFRHPVVEYDAACPIIRVNAVDYPS